MEKFTYWLATSPVATALKAGVAVAIALAVAQWQSDGAISFDHWSTWIIAGLGVAAPVIINWLNPSDERYGVNSSGS